VDTLLPLKREDQPRAPKVLWTRRLSEAILKPIEVADRFIVVESGGCLYAFDAVDGTVADNIDFTERMKTAGSHYFSFSGLDELDIKDLVSTPVESRALETNSIYDLSTLKKIYSRDGGMAGVPLVVGKRAYFGFITEWGDSLVIAFDLEAGEVIWEKGLDGHRTILKFPPTTDGERLYVRNLSHLTALDIRTGREVWNTKLTGKEKEEGFRDLIFFSAPVMYNRSLYLFRDEYIIPYRPKTGETNYNSWRRYLGSIGLNAMEAGPPPIVSRDKLFTAGGLYFISGQLASIGGDPGGFSRISSYDMAQKRALWEIDTGHASVDKMTLGGKFLVTADFKGKVLCLSSITGDILWGSKLEGGVRVKPVIFFGRAYFATDRGLLYCLAL